MATKSRFAIAKVVLSRYFWPTSLILLKQSFLSPSWAIHSEPIRARGIIVYYYAVSGPPLYSVYRYWDILTEKIWKIFIRKWVLANQRSERYFSHVKKKIETSNHSRERSFFQLWEKWYVQSKATEVCEFRAKIPAFYRLLQLAAPSLCELLRRYSTRKDN